MQKGYLEIFHRSTVHRYLGNISRPILHFVNNGITLYIFFNLKQYLYRLVWTLLYYKVILKMQEKMLPQIYYGKIMRKWYYILAEGGKKEKRNNAGTSLLIATLLNFKVKPNLITAFFHKANT